VSHSDTVARSDAPGPDRQIPGAADVISRVAWRTPDERVTVRHVSQMNEHARIAKTTDSVVLVMVHAVFVAIVCLTETSTLAMVAIAQKSAA
jgi:hypothetical protein